jgi:hypothetical protein
MTLRCSLWFKSTSIVNPGFPLRIILRIIIKLNRLCHFLPILDEPNLKSQTNATLSKLFFVQDYFQDKSYPMSIPVEVLAKTLASKSYASQTLEKSESENPKCLIHVRLNDSHDRSDHLLNGTLLSNILLDVRCNHFDIEFDIISDNPKHAETFLNGLGIDFKFFNLEGEGRLPNLTLLELFLDYNFVISSKSTLCWWGCYILTVFAKNSPIIYSFFNEQLRMPQWVNVTSRFDC